MAEVVPFRPDLIEAAHNIASAFARTDSKLRSMRVQIGLELIDAQRRFEAGELRDDHRFDGMDFWQFIKCFCHRSRADMRKCIALAQKEDPEEAAETERADARDRMQAHRAKQSRERSRPAQVVSIDPVQRALDLVVALTDEQFARFLVELREKRSW